MGDMAAVHDAVKAMTTGRPVQDPIGQARLDAQNSVFHDRLGKYSKAQRLLREIDKDHDSVLHHRIGS
jgi:hypothetical protein